MLISRFCLVPSGSRNLAQGKISSCAHFTGLLYHCFWQLMKRWKRRQRESLKTSAHAATLNYGENEQMMKLGKKMVSWWMTSVKTLMLCFSLLCSHWINLQLYIAFVMFCFWVFVCLCFWVLFWATFCCHFCPVSGTRRGVKARRRS